MNKKPRVLILTNIFGHMSMAEAAEDAYKSAGFTVKVVNLARDEKINTNSLQFFYDYFPFLTKIPYEIGKIITAQKFLSAKGETRRIKKIKSEIASFKPDIILSTLYTADFTLRKVKTKAKYLYLTHEPWADHPLLYFNAPDLTFVYDQRAKNIAVKNGVDKNKVAPIGWLVRPRFYSLSEKENQKTLTSLNFKRDVFTITICAGSGTSTVLKIVPALFKLPVPAQIIFIAGKSKTAYQAALAVAKVVNTSFANWESRIKMEVVGFTNKIDRYLKIADLVVGKAGSQLVFESIAAGKPFFAISHLNGLHDSLLQLIKRKRLGFVEERPQKAIDLLVKIAKNHKKILVKFNPVIERERGQNIRAADSLIRETKKFLTN